MIFTGEVTSESHLGGKVKTQKVNRRDKDHLDG